ncbi:MAG: hypothetical protein FWG74_01435 [Planctomycetes bacterium]|nr:hypothetical protein [Planctomycetota bacterium]
MARDVYKIPDALPGKDAPTHELADYLEILCWRDGITSERAMMISLGLLDDNLHGDEDDEFETSASEVMIEIERRMNACAGGYPFSFAEETGEVITRRLDWGKNRAAYLYCFMLLATRLDMQRHARWDNIDGTKIFEDIGRHALCDYLGIRDINNSIVFGTSAKGGFREKVDHMCEIMGEGEGVRDETEEDQDSTGNEKDGKIDAVAWLPFADGGKGFFSVFAQCKTGTSWEKALTVTQPDKFITKWCKKGFSVIPSRAFMIADSPSRKKWFNHVCDAGILFDRCRIAEHGEAIPDSLLGDIRRWTETAFDVLVMNRY